MFDNDQQDETQSSGRSLVDKSPSNHSNSEIGFEIFWMVLASLGRKIINDQIHDSES